MARQSITLSKPNNEWLINQVESEEYSSKSELINDLVRQARKQQVEIDFVRTKLIQAEKSGFTDEGPEQILLASKEQLHRIGEI